MRRLRRPLLLISVLTCGWISACAVPAKQGSSAEAARSSGSSDEISRDQIVAGAYQTAYDVVKALHPNWLTRHGPTGLKGVGAVQVFLDGTHYGEVERLQNIPSSSIGSITHIDAATATMRWGTGYTEGAVYVTTISR